MMSPSPQYTLLRTVGTFTKLQTATVVKLSWTAHAAMTNGFLCDFQLRIDGRTDDGATTTSGIEGAGRAVFFIGASGGGPQPAFGPLAVTAVYDGVPAGPRPVQIYVRGNADACSTNDGNFPISLIVEEMN